MFDYIMFDFPEMARSDVEKFYEAESNDFFKEFNYPKNNDTYAKVMRTQRLLGTKLDLSNIVEHTSERTESVRVHADTLHISNEIIDPINFDLTVTSRVASLEHSVPMLFSKNQFFESMMEDRVKENAMSV